MAQEETAGGGTLGRNPSFGVINPSGISPETAMRSIQEGTENARTRAFNARENELQRGFTAQQSQLDRAANESQFSRSHELAKERERFERMNADRTYKLQQDDMEFRKRMEEFAQRRNALDEKQKQIDARRDSQYNQGILEINADEARELSDVENEKFKLDSDSALLSAMHALLNADTPEERAQIAEQLTQTGIAEQFQMNSLMTALEDAKVKLDEVYTLRDSDMGPLEEMITFGDKEADTKRKTIANRATGESAKVIAEALTSAVIGNASIQSAANAGQSASEVVKGRLEDLFKNLFYGENIRTNYSNTTDFATNYATAQKNAVLSYQELEKMGVNMSMLDMAVYSLSKLTGGADSAKMLSSITSGQALEQSGVAPSGDADAVFRQRSIQGALNAFGNLRDDKGNRLAQNFGGSGLKVLFKQDPSTGKMVGYTTSEINKSVMELMVRLNSDLQTVSDPRGMLDELVANPTGGRYQGVLDSLPDPVKKQLVTWAKNERTQLETFVMSRPEQFRHLIDPKTGMIKVSRSELEKMTDILPTEKETKSKYAQKIAQYRSSKMPGADTASQQYTNELDALTRRYFGN